MILWFCPTALVSVPPIKRDYLPHSIITGTSKLFVLTRSVAVVNARQTGRAALGYWLFGGGDRVARAPQGVLISAQRQQPNTAPSAAR